MPTPQEIVASSKQQIKSLQTAERTIRAEIAAIEQKKRDNEATPADLKRLADLQAALDSVLAAMDDLNTITMKAMDDSDEIKAIRQAVVGVVKDLKKTAQRIARIGRVATQIGNVLGGVTALSDNLAALLKDDDNA
jgi:hypothetical protein